MMASRVKPERAVPRLDNAARNVLLIVGASMMLVVLNATGLNVALPKIGEDLGLAPGLLGWVLTTYLLVYGVAIPRRPSSAPRPATSVARSVDGDSTAASTFGRCRRQLRGRSMSVRPTPDADLVCPMVGATPEQEKEMATAAPAPTQSASSRTADSGPGAIHRGPPLGGLAVAFAGLFLASQIVIVTMTVGTFPNPYDAPETAQAYFGPNADILRIVAFLQFGSAIPLGIFTATVVSRLMFLGLTVAGITIAQFGGYVASIMLAFSGLTTWAITLPGMTGDLSTLRALQLLSFSTGGVGHVVGLGLLLAGVSVPAALARFLPRWIVWLGLVLAVLAELASVSMVLPMASLLLPLVRFPALVWLIAAGFAMPPARPANRDA
jgi:hypothetical protein